MQEPVFLNEEGKPVYDDGIADTREVIGATSASMGEDEGVINWDLTLKDGENVRYTNARGADDIIGALSDLPPAAQLPDLDLPEDSTLWNPDAPPQVFTRHEPIDDEPEPTLGQPPRSAQWKDPDDVSNTIALRSSNYGLYEDQAAVELQIKQAFENTPNWHKLKPDARCALDMIATKASRILTGKPDLHDSWHDIQGYSKLVADRILRDIAAMGGQL